MIICEECGAKSPTDWPTCRMCGTATGCTCNPSRYRDCAYAHSCLPSDTPYNRLQLWILRATYWIPYLRWLHCKLERQWHRWAMRKL